jgi:periplasmic protein CpxP/Spy
VILKPLGNADPNLHRSGFFTFETERWFNHVAAATGGRTGLNEEFTMRKLDLFLSMTAMLIFSAAAFAAAPQDAQSSQQPSAQSKTGHGHGSGEGHGRAMGMDPDAMLEHMSKELSLTDDQKTKIKPILEDQSKQMQELRQNTSASQEDRRAKMKQIHENTMSQLRPILTSDQQKKLDEMMSHHGEPGQRHPHSGDTSNPQ